MSFDENLDDDENLEIQEEEKKPPIKSKTPAVTKSKTPATGNKLSLYFTSTIGPGEKKQKLTVNDGNNVSDVKKTVGSMFGLDPDEFHLSSGGVTMDENAPLKNYDLNNGDDVLLIPASTAGAL